MSRIDQQVEQRLAELEKMDAATLRLEWGKVYGTPAPRRLSRDFLLRAVAYRVQELAYGGLKPAIVRRLRKIAEDLRNGKAVSSLPGPLTLRPGVRLMREWKGDTHVVDVVQKGFVWRGKRYTSLSSIARLITGTRWSGPRFFGLHDANRREAGRGPRTPL